MKNPLVTALAAAVTAMSAFGQDISLTGTVSGPDGKPVAGAVVKLLSAGVADTTGADGRYALTGTAIAIFGLAPAPADVAYRYRDGRFRFSSLKGPEAEISLHHLNGARAATLFRGRIAGGNLEVSCAGAVLRCRALLLRIRDGSRVSVHRLDPLGGGPGVAVAAAAGMRAGARSAARAAEAQSAGEGPALSRTGPGLAKAAAVDRIQAYKPGYALYSGEIDAYSGTRDIALAASVDPDFGPNVFIFDPGMPMATLQARINTVHAAQASAQFGTDRYAFLFKPGAYSLNVDVDYYVEALGLGLSPDDVAITGSVRSMSTTANNNVTLMFWRAAANMAVTPTANGLDTWAVSQGASFRRMHVQGSLALSMGGWASGGFLADTKVDKDVGSGSQQQWYTRNTEWAAWKDGVWNMFFDGVANPPAGAWPTRPYTVIPATPKIREKPFLYLDEAGRYAVRVPAVRENATGADWTRGQSPGESLPIELFHIAHPESDDAASLNAALASGRHLLLTPGIYHLDRSLQVTHPGTVILGLGMANLVADNGTAALTLSDVDGIKVAGILIDAGPVKSPVLLQVGEAGSAKSHAADPTSLHDIFLRVGGPRAGSAAAAVVINSADVIGDHFWIWRADHGAGAGWTGNTSANGLIVNGSNVSMYGLFVEHFQEYQTVWNGEGGRTHFYQSEMPYDPPNQAAWGHDGVKGYASYKVGPNVKTHEAWGVGVYCAFRAPVQSDHAIEAPAAPGVRIRHAVSIWLNGVDGSGINNVLNETGGAVMKGKQKATID